MSDGPLDKVLQETWEVNEVDRFIQLLTHDGETICVFQRKHLNRSRARAVVASQAPEMARIVLALVHAADDGRADNGAIFVGDGTIADARALLAALREAAGE
jgi:hypothetical protein